MKVVLTRDVDNLGKAGDLTNVAEGYARNFLLPRKMAVIADKGTLANIEKQAKMVEARGEKLLAEAQQKAQKIDQLKVVVEAKAGDSERIYGSVTNQEIAEALNAQHSIAVDRKKIHTKQPIKKLGNFEIPVKLHRDVDATIHVEVVAKSS